MPQGGSEGEQNIISSLTPALSRSRQKDCGIFDSGRGCRYNSIETLKETINVQGD
jgi:hypothetical protein